MRATTTRKTVLLISNLMCTSYGVHVLFDLNWVQTSGFYLIILGFSSWLLTMHLIKK